jgi:Holliday junction DNA helicase RuvA
MNMIASIRGTVLQVGSDHAVLETGGVGFVIYAPRQVLGGLGAPGDLAMLYTHLQVREDALTLYGFASVDQRQLFETLLGVTGIGPKVALSLLSSGPLDELRSAIAAGDIARLSRVPGIGKKTAERLVLELKGKIDLRGLPSASGLTPAAAAVNADLAEMLTGLGFSAAEANSAIAALPGDAPTDLEDRLRLALRYFGGA